MYKFDVSEGFRSVLRITFHISNRKSFFLFEIKIHMIDLNSSGLKMVEYYLEMQANKRIFYESKATLKNEHYQMHPFAS